MKLYLSSYLIPNIDKFSEFVGKQVSEIRFGLILNSKDYLSAKEREGKRDELLKYYSRFGLQVEEIDLREYFDDGDIGERLKDYDVMWFNGGNTYMLRWAIAQCRGEKAVLDALKNGVVYGGDSAGAIITGPTLKFFDMVDDSKVVEKPIYDGLNFVDFSILPHWNSEKYSLAIHKIAKIVKRKLEEDGYKTIKLTDEEFLLVEDGKIINKKLL